MADIEALNQDFRKYDQVAKSHTYRLAESSADELGEDYEIATLDFEAFLTGDEADQARRPEAFARPRQEIGFAGLRGHRVDPTLYAKMNDAVLDVFQRT